MHRVGKYVCRTEQCGTLSLSLSLSHSFIHSFAQNSGKYCYTKLHARVQELTLESEGGLLSRCPRSRT